MNDKLKINNVVLFLIINYLIEHATPEQIIKLDLIVKNTNNDDLIDKLIVLFDLDYIISQLGLLPDLAAIMGNMTTLDKVVDKIDITNIQEHKKKSIKKIPLSMFRWNR